MPQKFHERFDIDVPFEESQFRFLNRIHALVLNEYTGFMRTIRPMSIYSDVLGNVISALGMEYTGPNVLNYTSHDFLPSLHAVEAIYESISDIFPDMTSRITGAISRCFYQTEVDIGIRWENGLFYRTGAEELDETLVNQPLKWLRDQSFETVLIPYEKALRDFLVLDLSNERLSDVITDAYEAIEALAKIVCENNRDLSANAELFISTVNASDEYKPILRAYIRYANNFRHASNEGDSKPQLKRPEVESFVYMTGVIIRLVTQSER